MSTTGDAGPHTQPDEIDAPGPVAADRPVVDGTAASPEELRAEAERLDDPDRQRVDELRADVAATVDELAARLDVPARVRVRKDRVAADLRAAGAGARENPVLLGAVGAAVLLVFVVVSGRRARVRARAGR